MHQTIYLQDFPQVSRCKTQVKETRVSEFTVVNISESGLCKKTWIDIKKDNKTKLEATLQQLSTEQCSRHIANRSIVLYSVDPKYIAHI